MQLRRTAATAAIAALGGLAVLGTAPAATAATPSVTACPGNGKVSVSISNLQGVSIVQGDSRETVVTLKNDTGHAIKDFVGMLVLTDTSSHSAAAIGVDVKSGGKWHLATTPTEGVWVLTPLAPHYTVPAGAKLTYDLRLTTSTKVPTWPDPYAAVAMAGNGPTLLSKLNSNDSKDASGQAKQFVQSAVQGASATPNAGCSNDFGGDMATFKVTKPGAGTPTPAPSASSKPSTEPVSSVSTSPAASASPTGAVLAKTGGGNATLPVAVGGALVVLGAGAVVMTRRRKAARH